MRKRKPIPKTHPLVAAMATLTDRSILMDDLVAHVMTHGEFEDLAELAGMVDDLRQIVAFLADVVAAEVLLVDLVGYEAPQSIPSGGQLVLRGGSKRTNFDQSRLISKLKAAYVGAITKPAEGADVPKGILLDSGEVVPLSTVVDNTVDFMVAMTGAGTASFSSWRATPAKALDIKLGDFSETDHTPLKISVEGRNAITRLADHRPAGPVIIRTEHPSSTTEEG